MTAEGHADAFATAEQRRTVLTAWEASPSRFREDANAEDELVRGGYRDRVVVELVQNAADAASAAGTRGRVLLELRQGTLVVANTGVGVDADAVASLSSLRASTKRDADTVGQFGVGFAAVLAVSDEPTILTARGSGVTWSRSRARELAAQVPALADELARRGDAVPVLRLPFPVDVRSGVPGSEPAGPPSGPPAGYDTAVVLPLRDEAAVGLVRRLLTEVDDALALAFPDVAEIRIVVDGEERALSSGPAQPLSSALAGSGPGAVSFMDTAVSVVVVGDHRWAVAIRSGRADPALLADRPYEGRLRDRWDVRVAVLVDADDQPLINGVPTGRVVHAPTPTDERTDLPVLVMATFPVDSARRRVTPGPLTDHLVIELGQAYVDLVNTLGSPEGLRLIPMPLGAGALDTAMHTAVVDLASSRLRVPAAPRSTGGSDDADVLHPRDVVLIDGLDGRIADGVLATIIGGLPARAWWQPDVLRRLGAAIRPLADFVDDLASASLTPEDWRRVYAAIADAASDAGSMSELGALPVPLVDERVVRGPRGLVVPTEDVDAEALLALGLRVVDPAAAHPVLRRLGAMEATPATVLRDPAVRAAVENADFDQPDEIASLAPAILDLVAATGIGIAEEPWLAFLPVETAAGDFAPIGELWLADAPVVGFLDLDPHADVVAATAIDRYGRDLLAAVGATTGFRVVRDNDAALDDDFWHDLDGEDDYLGFLRDLLPDDDVPPAVTEFVAVADLDLVRPEAWPEALRLLTDDPGTRAAMVDRVVVIDQSGTAHRLPSYTAWWLRSHALVDGRLPTQMRSADTDDLEVRALFPVFPVALDATVAEALGVVQRLDDTTADVVLELLADTRLTLSATELATIYTWVSGADPDEVTPPDRVRVPDGTGTRVVDAAGVVVADGPHWLPVLSEQRSLTGDRSFAADRAIVAGPSALADVLDVPRAAEVVDVVVRDGEPAPVPEVAATVLPEARGHYVEHDELVIAGVDVSWWVDDVGTVHAATYDGLAAGLAWVAGRWDRRWVLAAALADPSAVERLLVEETY